MWTSEGSIDGGHVSAEPSSHFPWKQNFHSRLIFFSCFFKTGASLPSTAYLCRRSAARERRTRVVGSSSGVRRKWRYFPRFWGKEKKKKCSLVSRTSCCKLWHSKQGNDPASFSLHTAVAGILTGFRLRPPPVFWGGQAAESTWACPIADPAFGYVLPPAGPTEALQSSVWGDGRRMPTPHAVLQAWRQTFH